MAGGLMARLPVSRVAGGGMIGGWWLGERMLGPGGSMSLLRDACKIIVAHILAFRDNIQIPPPPTTLS